MATVHTPIAPEAGDASADARTQPEVATFTKWVTDWPNMAGTVGGFVGDGAYSGKVFDHDPGPTTVIAAQYQFNGSDHQFTALMHVEQTDLHADIVGVVTDGWGKGRRIRGEYDQIQCEHDGVTTDCYQGSIAFARSGD